MGLSVIVQNILELSKQTSSNCSQEKNGESMKYQEAIKQLRKVERRMKELAMAAEEEKKEKDKHIELADRANKKVLQIKKQMDDMVSGPDLTFEL